MAWGSMRTQMLQLVKVVDKLESECEKMESFATRDDVKEVDGRVRHLEIEVAVIKGD